MYIYIYVSARIIATVLARNNSEISSYCSVIVCNVYGIGIWLDVWKWVSTIDLLAAETRN